MTISPVPARPLSPREVQRYTRAILRAYRTAPLDSLVTGADWYPHAHRLAGEIAAETGLTTRAVAGVIAALSPQNAWAKNLADARRACRTRSAAGLHTRCQAGKADAILAGADPLDILGGPKERAFFATIADPADPYAVVVDRHAHDVAVGRPFGDVDRGLSSVHRYANLALAYRRAARVLGVAPSTVQAVTWQSWTGRTTLEILPPADDVEAADRDVWAADVCSPYGK